MTDDEFLARHEPHRSPRRGRSFEVWLIVAIWLALLVMLLAAGFSLYWK